MKPLQVAISNTEGEDYFLLSSEHERSSLYRFNATFGNAQVKEVVKVNVRTLDSFSGQLPPPQHIKIDAEGSESNILEGAAEIIRRQKPLLYIEPHSIDDEERINEILKKLDYEFENYKGHYVCNPIGSPKPLVKAQ